MREVVWIDNSGWKHRSLVREADPDHLAEHGLPIDPPDLRQVDWDGVARELNNALVDARLSSWQDILDSQNMINMIILKALKRPVLDQFKLKATALKKGGG